MKFGESPPTLALPLFFRKCFTQGSRCHSAWLPSRCRCKKKNSSLPVQSFEKFGIRKPTLFKKHFCITRNKNGTKNDCHVLQEIFDFCSLETSGGSNWTEAAGWTSIYLPRATRAREDKVNFKPDHASDLCVCSWRRKKIALFISIATKSDWLSS